MYHRKTVTTMNKPFVRNEIRKIDGGPIREAPEPQEKDGAFDRMMKPFDQVAEEDNVWREEPPKEQPPTTDSRNKSRTKSKGRNKSEGKD